MEIRALLDRMDDDRFRHEAGKFTREPGDETHLVLPLLEKSKATYRSSAEVRPG
jgi:hypothetical protein